MKKLFIFGSRSLTCDMSAYITERPDVIIHGGAVGIDSAAQAYADSHGIPCEVYKPDYKRHGRAATHVRNDAMIAACTHALAVYDGSSRGTASVIKKLRRTTKVLTVHIVEVA